MLTLFNIRPKGFNIGNDAINVALRELVHSAFGRVVNIIELPAVSTYESQAKAGLTARMIHEINRLGDGVIVGGGNLYENNELAVDTNALRALNVPMMLFSLSRGRVYSRQLELVQRTDVMPDQIIKALHDVAGYSLARDSVTYNHIKSLGCDQVVFGGCPTIFLAQAAERLPKLPEAEVPGALISVRAPTLMNVPARLQAKVQNDIEGIIRSLRDRGYKRIRLLCHDIRDVEFATIFQATHSVDYVYTSDIYWYLSLLKHAELVVSYRLHAWLPCLSFDTPTIKISYDERALCLADDLGYGDWNINMAEVSNVVGEVDHRLDRLDTLPELKQRSSRRWAEIAEIQHTQMSAFADDVRRYARAAHSRSRTIIG